MNYTYTEVSTDLNEGSFPLIGVYVVVSYDNYF